MHFSCVLYIYAFAKPSYYHHIMLDQEPNHVLNTGGPNSFFGVLVLYYVYGGLVSD